MAKVIAENVSVKVNAGESVEEILISSQSPRFTVAIYQEDVRAFGQFDEGTGYTLQLVKHRTPEPDKVEEPKGKAKK